tara:strand:+ start:45 stop:977 length:933 start_codon:yes stop_codon:yes gene_type:complete
MPDVQYGPPPWANWSDWEQRLAKAREAQNAFNAAMEQEMATEFDNWSSQIAVDEMGRPVLNGKTGKPMTNLEVATEKALAQQAIEDSKAPYEMAPGVFDFSPKGSAMPNPMENNPGWNYQDPAFDPDLSGWPHTGSGITVGWTGPIGPPVQTPVQRQGLKGTARDYDRLMNRWLKSNYKPPTSTKFRYGPKSPKFKGKAPKRESAYQRERRKRKEEEEKKRYEALMGLNRMRIGAISRPSVVPKPVWDSYVGPDGGNFGRYDDIGRFIGLDTDALYESLGIKELMEAKSALTSHPDDELDTIDPGPITEE